MVARLLSAAVGASLLLGLVGCGGPEPVTESSALPTPTQPTPAGQAPKKAAPGMIDDFSVKPAPPGVQTGTPGG